jgi:hypothetical protein
MRSDLLADIALEDRKAGWATGLRAFTRWMSFGKNPTAAGSKS